MKKITADEVDRIVAIADQFLEDWCETDEEQPLSDRDDKLTSQLQEWHCVRPLLVAAPRLADLVEKILAYVPESETLLRLEVIELLSRLAKNRTFESAPVDTGIA